MGCDGMMLRLIRRRWRLMAAIFIRDMSARGYAFLHYMLHATLARFNIRASDASTRWANDAAAAGDCR